MRNEFYLWTGGLYWSVDLKESPLRHIVGVIVRMRDLCAGKRCAPEWFSNQEETGAVGQVGSETTIGVYVIVDPRYQGESMLRQSEAGQL